MSWPCHPGAVCTLRTTDSRKSYPQQVSKEAVCASPHLPPPAHTAHWVAGGGPRDPLLLSVPFLVAGPANEQGCLESMWPPSTSGLRELSRDWVGNRHSAAMGLRQWPSPSQSACPGHCCGPSATPGARHPRDPVSGWLWDSPCTLGSWCHCYKLPVPSKERPSLDIK